MPGLPAGNQVERSAKPAPESKERVLGAGGRAVFPDKSRVPTPEFLSMSILEDQPSAGQVEGTVFSHGGASGPFWTLIGNIYAETQGLPF